jgi:F-type H+-transporting ATPase subunit gamma
METLDALRAHIDTTRDLQSIVRTMKSLSAASIRHYEQAVFSLRQYSEAVRLGFQIVLRTTPPPKATEGPSGAIGVIVIGSDHGLCGRFNEQIVRFARSALPELNPSGADELWLALGLRASARLEAEGVELQASLPQAATVAQLAPTVHSLLLRVDRWKQANELGHLYVFHNARDGANAAASRKVQLLPLDPQWLERLAARPWKSRTLPLFTMQPDALFSSLVRQHLFVTLYRAAAESLAGEHASRLAAMQTAEKNIEEHLAEMTTAFHRKRQETITAELLEIVAGFEAAKSGAAATTSMRSARPVS